jgi:uncharacterized repeat protein (TIGR03803 family)
MISRSCAVAWFCGFVLWLVVATSAQAQNYKVLYAFQCGADGARPDGNLVRDSAGNLYGTTHEGGAYDYGTVFEISASGMETLLHSFAGPPTDGEYPFAGVIRDGAGNLYGTVFEVSANATETVLYSFGNAPDGENPMGGLLRDGAGNLCGTTYSGGSSSGTVFKLTPAGAETVLYSFDYR